MWKIEKIVSKGEYDYAVVKTHPKRTKHGYVLHHRVVMENHLGRLLNRSEIVHHKNNDKKDNRIENLELLTVSEHSKIHALYHGRRWCILKCPECDVQFNRPKNTTFLQKKGEYSCCSKKCRGKFSRRIQLAGKTPEVERAISENLVREYIKYSHDNSEETI